MTNRPARIPKAIAACGLLVMLCACGPHGAALMAANGALVSNTDKTAADHVAGWIRGEECSSLRFHNGGHWCVESYENRPFESGLYCYRTLGNIDCFKRPLDNGNDTLIGRRDGGLKPTW